MYCCTAVHFLCYLALLCLNELLAALLVDGVGRGSPQHSDGGQQLFQ
jgi:hypothetical protein